MTEYSWMPGMKCQQYSKENAKTFPIKYSKGGLSPRGLNICTLEGTKEGLLNITQIDGEIM